MVFVPGDGLWVGTHWIEEDGGVFVVHQDGAGVRSWLGNGASISGPANALGYFNPAGNALTGSAALTAAPVDPFGRPQLWDRRVGGAGAVFRQGSWTADGDPGNVLGDGLVIYGRSENGNQNAGEGGYARVKSDRFGLFEILPGGPAPSFYAFRVDYTEMYLRRGDAVGTYSWRVTRASGNTVQTGTATLGAFTVALLPVGSEGARAWASNGRKVGEGPGAGTGVPVYWSAGSWRVYSTDAPVAA